MLVQCPAHQWWSVWYLHHSMECLHQGIIHGHHMVSRHIGTGSDDSMSAVLHGLLSANDKFVGECKEFTHLITNSQGN
jgi:hypothetical protein